MLRTLLLLILVATASHAQNPTQADRSSQQIQTISARVSGLQRHDGFIPFYWDVRRGELLLELNAAALDREFLYFTALGSGVGSLDTFADRSSFGGSYLGRFMRVGPRVLLMEENERFRATEGSPELQHSVEL